MKFVKQGGLLVNRSVAVAEASGHRFFCPAPQCIRGHFFRICIAAVAMLSLFAPASHATVLESVDWTGVMTGTWSYGTVSGTTGSGVTGAGQILTQNWGALPFSSGYSTTVNDALVLAAANNSGAVRQTLTFTQSVQSPYLFFNYIDNGTSFDFGSYNWSLIGASNASRVGSTMVVNGSNDQSTDGFLVLVNETFGPGANLQFDFNNPTFTGQGGGHTVGFTVAVPVPEPATYAMALAGLACGGYSMWRRRKRA